MTHGISLASPLDDLEVRVARLEQSAAPAEQTGVSAQYDTAGKVGQISPLTYLGDWESYPKFTTTTVAGIPSGTWSDDGLLTPTVSRVGTMIFLAGVIRRTAASTGTILGNINQNSPMFLLPTGWRPSRSVFLSCPCVGNSAVAPEAAAQMGMAMLMVIPNPSQPSGMVKLITTTVNLNAGTASSGSGWISLNGAFPGAFTTDSPVSPPAGTWDAVHPGRTWDDINPTMTWADLTESGGL